VNLNRVELVGGLTKDPVVREGRNGGQFVELQLAVNGTRFDPDEGKQVVSTTFVVALLFGPPADLAGELTKGDEVYLLGELGQREVRTKDGETDRKTRVYAAVCYPTRVHRAVRQQEEVWR
jgi:single stranded DNA-binding protein